ncbi:MAG: FlgK family flagellar hook-associated protein, partial [Candidatus Binataceae bacterium]
MADIVSIGLTGVAAAQEELAITSSNIANASNPNYSAESVSLAAIPSGLGGSAGVEVTGIDRAQVPFLNPQINDAQSGQDSAAAFSQIVQSTESYLAPQSGLDLGGAAQKLLTDFLSLSGSPEDVSLRQGLLTDAQALAQQSQSIDSGMAQLVSNSISGLPSLVAEVNS